MKLRLFITLFGLISAICASAQVLVTGTVSDGTGETLPGVSVVLKSNPKIAAATNIDGRFALSVPDLNATLNFSFVGYKPQSVALNGRNDISVVLSEDTEALEELVVVGYGVQKKVSLTGSVSAVSGNDLIKAPMQNVSNLLTGKVSGITSVQTTGKPGADGASINVRGINSFSGSTGPMVIVDGVPMDMNQVNPQDIESISVLKDASASIYGVQGANGVILVTTKKGQEGKAKISYGGSFTWTHNTALPEYLNATEYMYWHNKASMLDGLTPRYDAEIQRRVLAAAPDDYLGETDWIKETFRTGFTQQHNVSATGGTANVNYFVSIGLLDQEGTMRNTEYRRYNFRSNLDVKVAKNLRFTANIAGYRTERLWPAADLGEQNEFNPSREALTMLPIFKKTYNGLPVAWSHDGADTNPISSLEGGGWNRLYSNRLISSFQLEYDFKDIHPLLDGLKASVWASYDANHGLTDNYSGSILQYAVDKTFAAPSDSYPVQAYKPGFGKAGEGSFFRGSHWTDNWIFRPQINYNHKFGKADVGIMYLYEATKYTGGVFQALAKGYVADDPVDITLADSIDPTSVKGSHQNTSVVSHVGRINLGWDDKYLVEFAFRRDGSYKFAPENRWGFFPSVSAGWVLSNESFIKDNIPWIDFLKLRASYGEAGMDNITPFLYNSLFTKVPNGTIMNGSPLTLYYTNSYIDRNLRWSTTRSYNVGIDIDVLQRKLGAEIDVFYQHTDDILERVSGAFPSSLGGNVPSYENSGAVDNRGVDFSIHHELAVTKDFSYRLRGTFGFARNKVLKQKTNDDHPSWRSQLGHSMGARFGLIATGLAQTQEQIDNAPACPSGEIKLGDLLYVDTNGDGKIMYKGSESDYVRIGYGALPEITFSMNMDFNYRNFYLNMLWQGVSHVDYSLLGAWGNGHTDSTPYTKPFYGDANSPKYLVEEAWTPENTDARYPRLSTVVNGNNSVASTWWLINGEYLRLKSLTFGYEIPEKLLGKTPFTRVNVYVAGTNVWTLSHFKWVDPESPSVSAGYYPQQATWSLGLNVAF